MHSHPAPQKHPTAAWALQALFVLSGFSALIYQSIWTHYLGLSLGHAAYAQTVVLIMFMGGMALGSWWVSRFAEQLQRPLWLYAGVECLIGLFGLAFDPGFRAVLMFSQDQVLPAIASPGLAKVWQWGSSALLVAPQTVLLGTTFPLIAAGLLRMRPHENSRSLGSLYWTNSIGAAIGALASVFYLLPALGMPGALKVAAAINLVLAAGTAWLSRGTEHRAPPPAQARDGQLMSTTPSLLGLVLWATFGSSAASFAYEVGWVRMLNLALGSSLHSFELMLATFIAGLAFGGLWVRQRGHRWGDPLRAAALMQILMGVCAIGSVALVGQSYHWVVWLLQGLARNDTGYDLYLLGTAAIAVLIMMPAAFFAGTTLPLFTAGLLRQGAGERAVGQVYAANTLGAILGVLIAVHGLIPRMGVTLTVLSASGVDVVIGLLLMRQLSQGRWRPLAIALGTTAAFAMGACLHWGLPDRALQSSGVFRTARLPFKGRQLLYFSDGATATTSVAAYNGTVNIATNGKSDAAISSDDRPASPDELTMLTLAALPLALHPQPTSVALIGWGSGLSTHTVLGSPAPQSVDTIEIEPNMREGASLMMDRNYRAYNDPRSNVHFEDAREYFARSGKHYDIIISEPSNPWVSGVASLFTQEFYRRARASLAPGGLLTQWLHTYELSNELLGQIMAALLESFPDAELYEVNSGDLVIVAPRDRIGALSEEPWKHPDLAKELSRVGLKGSADLAARRLAGAKVLKAFARSVQAQPHSDFHPTVTLLGARERFKGSAAATLAKLAGDGLPILEVLECRRQDAALPALTGAQDDPPSIAALHRAQVAAHTVLTRSYHATLARLQPSLSASILALIVRIERADVSADASLQADLAQLAQATLGTLPQAQAEHLWGGGIWGNRKFDFPNTVKEQLALYAAVTARDWATVSSTADRLLALKDLQPSVAEQVLVLRMLAGLAQDQFEEPSRLEQRWAEPLGAHQLSAVRRLLIAWGELKFPACPPARKNTANSS